MTITRAVMRPSEIGLEGEAVSLVTRWEREDVEQAMIDACAGQAAPGYVRHDITSRAPYDCAVVFRSADADAVRWLGEGVIGCVCAALGVPKLLVENISLENQPRDSGLMGWWRFTIPDHHIEPLKYLEHRSGRQCAAGVECPLCVRLEPGFVGGESGYAMQRFEEHDPERHPFGEPRGDGWHDNLFSSVGEMQVFTRIVPANHYGTERAKMMYRTSVFASREDHSRHGLASEECWTQAQAYAQHRRMLLKVARGEVGHG